MLIAVTALTMSLSLMASAVIIMHNEGRNLERSRKNAVIRKH